MSWKAGIRVRSYRIVLTRRTKDDIVDIGDYITYTLLEPETALNFVKGLRKSIATLKDFPQRFELIEDEVLASQGIHCSLLNHCGTGSNQQ